jgi:predicted Zn finger-like uncharacterized protein
MLTRCPHCQTAFRVTTEQLKVRQGRVRCGSCRAVFDALDSLTDELAIGPVVAAPVEVEQPQENLAPQETEFAIDLEFDIPEPEATGPEPEAEPEPDTSPEPEPAPEIVPESDENNRHWQDGAKQEHEVAEVAEIVEITELDEVAEDVAEKAATPPAPETVTESATEEQALPESWESVPAVTRSRRWPWVIGILATLLLAAGQLLFIFRVELAVVSPELRPALQAGCDLFGCTVPRPRKPELVGIENSDLAPAGEHRLLLTALLKNRAPFAQEYPSLELTLTDTQDEALLRKVLPPADYLPADKLAAAGFAARGEVAVKLSLATDDVPAVGYRLYLFYP